MLDGVVTVTVAVGTRALATVDTARKFRLAAHDALGAPRLILEANLCARALDVLDRGSEAAIERLAVAELERTLIMCFVCRVQRRPNGERLFKCSRCNAVAYCGLVPEN